MWEILEIFRTENLKIWSRERTPNFSIFRFPFRWSKLHVPFCANLVRFTQTSDSGRPDLRFASQVWLQTAVMLNHQPTNERWAETKGGVGDSRPRSAPTPPLGSMWEMETAMGSHSWRGQQATQVQLFSTSWLESAPSSCLSWIARSW